MEKEVWSCQIKVVAATKLTPQRFADIISKIVRSWVFVVCQIVFIGGWIISGSHFGFDDKSFDILKLILMIEGVVLAPILWMSFHNELDKDRRIVYNDYFVDCLIRKEAKEIHPLITALYKDMQEKKIIVLQETSNKDI